MSLAYYTMDDLRLGRGGFLQKGWTIRQRPELGEALAHYRGMPITKRKVLGLTDGFHVLELVKNVPLFPDDPEGEDVLASELGEPLPQWADTPEACQAFRACVEELGLRYQIEGKILAPIPVNKKQRRKKLAGKYATVYTWLTGGSQFVNQADVGGVYNGQWIMATSRWVTKVYKPSEPLPRTGY